LKAFSLQLKTWFGDSTFAGTTNHLRVSTKLPYLVLVTDDPYAADIVVYPLEEGSTYFGSELYEQTLDSSSISLDDNHSFILDGNDIAPMQCSIIHSVELQEFDLSYRYYDCYIDDNLIFFM
jgi:hypothetical protein